MASEHIIKFIKRHVRVDANKEVLKTNAIDFEFKNSFSNKRQLNIMEKNADKNPAVIP
jgi:hypothetical protein